MKIKLTKSLLTFLTIAAASTAQADVVTPTHIWNEGGEMELKASPKEDGYTINLKDGQNEATITKDADTTSALYVREGTLIIGGLEGVENRVNVSISPVGGGQLQNDDYPTILNIAGKNAQLIIDNATVTSNTETSMSVGGPDGNGSLIIRNGGQYLGNKQNYFFIGYQSYRKENSTPIDDVLLTHATTKLPGQDASVADNRYDSGDYSYNSDESREYGRAVVTVTGEGSRMETGLHGMHMGDGEVNILDNAVFNSNSYAPGDVDASGTLRTGGATSLGDVAGGTSIVNVKDGAVWNIHGQLHTGNAADSKSVINVENATVNLLNLRGSFLGLGYDRHKDDYFENGSTTEFNLQDGAQLNISEEMYVGVYNHAKITVAKTAVIRDFGNIHGANDPGYGPAYQGTPHDRLIVDTFGILENAGTLDIYTVVTGGDFIMQDGAVAKSLTSTAGTVNLSGNMTFKGDVEIGGSTKLTFALGCTMNIAGDVFTFDANNGIIYVEIGDSLVNAETDVLFTLGYTEADSLQIAEGTLIQLLQNGTKYGEAVRFLVGTNVATKVIPEPATATLSLLALVGMAARRRRK